MGGEGGCRAAVEIVYSMFIVCADQGKYQFDKASCSMFSSTGNILVLIDLGLLRLVASYNFSVFWITSGTFLALLTGYFSTFREISIFILLEFTYVFCFSRQSGQGG